jgi:hypothetical protein
MSAFDRMASRDGWSDEAVPGAASRAPAILRVAVIGGLTRATSDWQRAGDAIGAVVEHHDGRTAGHRAATIASIVSRADVVITITVPNSHNAVAIARRAAAAHHRPFILVKRLRPSSLADLVAEALANGRSADRGASRSAGK